MTTEQHEKWMRMAMIWQMGLAMIAVGAMPNVPDVLKDQYLSAVKDLTETAMVLDNPRKEN